MNIKEIALRLVNGESRFRIGLPAGLTQDFAHALVAELSKQEPVAEVVNTDNGFAKFTALKQLAPLPPVGTYLFTHPLPVKLSGDDDAYAYGRSATEIEALRARVAELEASNTSLQQALNEALHSKQSLRQQLSAEQDKVKVLVDALESVNNQIYATVGQPLETERYFKIRTAICDALATVKGKVNG